MANSFLKQVIDCDPLTVSPETFVVEAMEQMSQTDSSTALVVEEREIDSPCLLGVLTAQDAVHLIASDTPLPNLRVREVMGREPVMLKASKLKNLGSILVCLRQYSLSQIPIVGDRQQLLGVVRLPSLLEILTKGDRALPQEQEKISTLQRTNSLLQQDLTHRRQAELKVRQLNAKLNRRIVEKISQLERVNETLEASIAECSLLERKVRSNEGEMRSLLAGISDLTLVIDREVQSIQVLPTDFTRSSAAAASILDQTIEKFWGTEGEAFLAAIDRVSTHQQAIVFDYHLAIELPNTGRATQQQYQNFWFSANISPLSDSTVLWVARDINKRKQAEQLLHNLNQDLEQRVRERTAQLQQTNEQLQAEIRERQNIEEELRENEMRFRELTDRIRDVFFIKKADASHFLYISPAYEDIWQRTRDNLYKNPQSWLESVHPEDRDRLTTSVKERQLQGQPFQTEYRILRSDGLIRWIFARTFPIYGETGQLLRHVGLAEDITKRKLAEIALQQREERLRSQQAAIVELSEYHDIYAGRLNGTLQKIAEVAVRTLGVERVSIWFYRTSRTQIEQVDLYELSQNRHSCGQYLSVESYPCYFQALETQETIAADDARRDPRTREFLKELLVPCGITSMLDVPIRSGGTTVGVICHEHVGSPRCWTVEEQNFASYLANLVSLGLESRDRLRAEEALKESEARYRSVVDLQTDLICRYLADGTITFVNSSLCRHAGLATEDIIGLKLTDFIVAEDRELLVQHLSSLTPESPTGTIENRSRLPDGEIRWQQWHNRAIYDACGNLVEFQGIGRDITKRKQAEGKLRATQERFQYLLASNPAIVYTFHFDSDYSLTFISPNVEEILGYGDREFLATSHFWIEQVHPEDQPMFLKQRSSLVHNLRYTCEYRFLDKEGTYRWLRDDVKLLRDRAGNPLEAIGSLIDISDRKRAEAEVLKTLKKERELVELKSRFISIASHEFRTPLTVIKSSAQLLSRYEWSREEQQPYLQQIQTSVGHMTSLLNDVLALNRVEAGKLEFNPMSIELVEFCRHFIEEMQIGAKDRAIQFSLLGNDTEAKVSPEDYRVQVKMDKKLLRQILSNLFSNALKYSPTDQPIIFTLYYRPQAITFHIQDFGIGIPRPDQHRIFESFYRARNISTIQGTGLGLSIVKGFVEQYGGTIDFCSQPGEGTVFSVTLPRFRDAQDAVAK